MRIVLEVVSGPQAGQKRRLVPGQILKVGRTEWADFTLPGDEQMSGIHFALEATHGACYVQDLKSTNGTRLNDQPLAEKAIVRDGDRITAGRTQFTLHVEGAPAGLPADEPPAAVKATVPVTQAFMGVERGAAAAVGGRYRRTTCTSQQVLYSGSAAETQPAALAAGLAGIAPMWLIVDPHKLPAPLPETASEPAYLMNWLPEESRAAVSPMVLGPPDGLQLPAVLGAAWGKDAAVAIYSELEPEELLSRIRPAAGAFIRPSLLAPQLSQAAKQFVETHLTAGIRAVLVEGASAEQWQVFADAEFEATLQQLGLVPEEGERT